MIYFSIQKLKDLAKRFPEGQPMSCTSHRVAEHASEPLQPIDTAPSNTSEGESNSDSPNQTLPIESRSQTGKESVVQDEPGVYLTLTSLADGGTELTRVRFR